VNISPAELNSPALLGNVVRSGRRNDWILAVIGVTILFLALTVLVSLLASLVADGFPRLVSGDFYFTFPSRKPAQAGILSAWVGTLVVMLVTALLAILLGVGAGLYLEEYSPRNRITDLIEINVSNLAGVPSIIYGLLALGLFVQTFGLGETIRVAGMVLALLILPVIIVATREALRSIPQELREAAFGLGADQWQTVRMYGRPCACTFCLQPGLASSPASSLVCREPSARPRPSSPSGP
jgi:phosphate transport system permease protein